ncbi:S-adenosyl-L-methionine-dependent methyltransferase [Mycena albidolilacea]|uniref:S-adenosyl-L-methionine-dependent methyltransferase n=1 Tax=Mycena albidolilacea TaxID=1033008 RepID=A0AAD7F637_9AGAR|nr:S-adenosyl-L-methionine-dependent methyltransferase [Mycena albidolilacea]
MAQSIQKIISALDSIPAELDGKERTQVTEALRRTLARLQTPFERSWEMMLLHPLVYAACQTGIDLDLWKGWYASGGGQKSLAEVVKMCSKDCDPNLLRRLLRLLVIGNVVEETGPDTFEATVFSLAMGEKSLAMTLEFGTHHLLQAALEIPSHLAQTAYQEPTTADNTAYTKMGSNPEKLAFFARCRERPEYGESFIAVMSNTTAWKQNWTEYFDTSTLVDEAVIENGKTTPILVDVGGNIGLDITRFLEKHPNVPTGSLVLQDTSDTIAMAKVDPRIRAMAHDFFQPQPILGSRIYYLHAILHDWADSQALQIISNLVPAFKRGYSKLLITDIVIPPKGAGTFQATIDVLMMTLLAGGERTEATWTKLLNTAGFKIVKVWPDARGIECVIEAELDEESSE